MHMCSDGAYIELIELIDGQLMLFYFICHKILLKFYCLSSFYSCEAVS